jgi:predicted RNase H-like HicB family nuclease
MEGWFEMNFQIGGKRYEVARDDVLNATRDRTPGRGDGRHKYFVRLHGRHYPIKQVVQLVTGLTSAKFTSQYAHGILTALDFVISERSSSGAVFVDASDNGGEALRLLVVFETDEDGWEVASCPTLPGCHSQGRTRSEALSNIGEAIRGYLASMREHATPAPSSSEFTVVDVTA